MIDYTHDDGLKELLSLARQRMNSVDGHNPEGQSELRELAFREGFLHQELKIRQEGEPRRFGPVTYGLGGLALACYLEDQRWIGAHLLID